MKRSTIQKKTPVQKRTRVKLVEPVPKKTRSKKTEEFIPPTPIDDKYARYGQYHPNEFTPEVFEQIKHNKDNSWANAVRKNDYKYDSRYLDKEFLAYQAARKGLIPYYGDFDNDGVPDSALVDQKMGLKQFNGYSQKPSKRPQYTNFYENNPPQTFSDNGFPEYDDFDEYIERYADDLEAKKTREAINKDLKKKGFAEYKVKEKTFNEIVSDAIRTEYKNNFNNYANDLGVTPAYLKRLVPVNTLVSLYVRSLLNSLFGVDPTATSDSNHGRWITKTINKKYPSTHQFAGFKQNLLNAFDTINGVIGRELIKTICNLINKGYNNTEVLYNIVQLIQNQINSNPVLNNISSVCKSAIQTRVQESKRDINLNKK